MNKRLERARSKGKPVTRAWNPEIDVKPYTTIAVDGEAHELVRVQADLPPEAKKTVVDARAYHLGPYAVIASIDKTRHGNILHVSIAHKEHFPSWEVISAVKRVFFHPDVAAVMLLPENGAEVHFGPFDCHVWQLPEKWSIA